MLRLGDQRYRTCMECVGQGRLPALAPATTVVAVLQGEGMQGEGLQGEGSPTEVPQLQRQRAADVIALEDRRRFNGSVSSSAAR
jgi:hypothetical protein